MIILISLITMPLIATGWDVGTSGGVYVSIPGEVQEDALKPLMSATVSLISSPFIITIFPALLISTPIEFTYTTRSQFNGPIYYKDFATIAGGIEFTFGPLTSMSTSISLLYALQIKDDERGWFGFLITKGSFLIPITDTNERQTLLAIFNIEVELRSDYTGLRIGTGLRYRYMRKKI